MSRPGAPDQEKMAHSVGRLPVLGRVASMDGLIL